MVRGVTDEKSYLLDFFVKLFRTRTTFLIFIWLLIEHDQERNTLMISEYFVVHVSLAPYNLI